jgi:putative flippase GtrA
MSETLVDPTSTGSGRFANVDTKRNASGLFRQLTRFAVVGGVGFVVDVTVFNLLRATVFSGQHDGPIVAKVLSTIVAIAVNWVGNRYWAFRQHRSDHVVRESISFVAASLLGLVVSVGCLWVSHDLLRLTSVLDDNISSNVVGLALGSIVRFALYRAWVYRSGVASAD